MDQRTPESGIMIVVVGPSGAGKDSLINAARRHYESDPRIGFVQRVITRPSDGATEDHVSATLDEFADMKRSGNFAVTWGAHGLHYGIPGDTLATMADGKTLIANGSRAALESFRAAYPRFAVLEVTARPDVIASRLKLRGRESGEEIEKRLARVTADWQTDCIFMQVDNSDDLARAERDFIAAVEYLTGHGALR